MNFLQTVRLLKWIIIDKDINTDKIEQQGLLAVKIAQMFAMRIDLLSPEKCKKLSKLLGNTNTNIPAEDIHALLEKYVDTNWHEQFAELDPKPFASASIGQVHKGVLKDGSEVAVKLLKADFTERFKKDVASAQRVFKFFAFFYPKLKLVADPKGILEDIESNTLAELDLRNEIKNQIILKAIHTEASKDFDLSELLFPKIYKELSNEHVLVRELINGKTVDELTANNKLPYETMVEIFRAHGFYIFTRGTFHGDIHAGNIMVNADQKIFFIDTGALAVVPEQLRIGLFKFISNLSRYNYDGCVQALNNMAESKLTEQEYQQYKDHFYDLYKNFKGKTVGEVSLTRQMMFTIKSAIEHGMRFERGMFPIIKSMMYLDAMVLKCNSSALILEDMRPLTKELAAQFPELQDDKEN